MLRQVSADTPLCITHVTDYEICCNFYFREGNILKERYEPAHGNSRTKIYTAVFMVIGDAKGPIYRHSFRRGTLKCF